jgi:glycosyltransferase involved in cell wall biosynthesis
MFYSDIGIKRTPSEIEGMRILYVGSFDRNYSRNRIILKGLAKNGVEVLQLPYARRFSKLSELFRRCDADYDAIVVGFLGHYDIPFASLLARRSKKPLVFDVFVSLYDTFVFDRRLIAKGSFKSYFYFYLDKFDCMLADAVLLDTDEHINHFSEEFKVKREKFRLLRLGADDDIFFPREPAGASDRFKVTFHGTFIPLQGVEYIVKAAKILESDADIKFEILGNGQTFNSVYTLSKSLNLHNVAFLNELVRYEELPSFIAKADISLGIFGDTPKAMRVVPNKVYETLAMGKPLLTGDTPAAREILTDQRDCLLCDMANPEAIAASILSLKDDDRLRSRIAKNGYQLFVKKFSTQMIGEEMKRILEKL